MAYRAYSKRSRQPSGNQLRCQDPGNPPTPASAWLTEVVLNGAGTLLTFTWQQPMSPIASMSIIANGTSQQDIHHLTLTWVSPTVCTAPITLGDVTDGANLCVVSTLVEDSSNEFASPKTLLGGSSAGAMCGVVQA